MGKGVGPLERVKKDTAIKHLLHYPLCRKVKNPPTPLWSLFYGQHRRIRLLINGGTPSYERSPQDEKPVFCIPKSIWKEGLRLSVTP